jgi:hypothetical protein
MLIVMTSLFTISKTEMKSRTLVLHCRLGSPSTVHGVGWTLSFVPELWSPECA